MIIIFHKHDLLCCFCQTNAALMKIHLLKTRFSALFCHISVILLQTQIVTCLSVSSSLFWLRSLTTFNTGKKHLKTFPSLQMWRRENKWAGFGLNHKASRVSALFAFPLLWYAIILASVMKRGDEGDTVSLRGGRVCKIDCVVVSRKPFLCQLESTTVDGRAPASQHFAQL